MGPASGETVPVRILDLLEADPAREWTIPELSSAIPHAAPQSVRNAIGDLLKRGTVAKVLQRPGGQRARAYRAANGADR